MRSASACTSTSTVLVHDRGVHLESYLAQVLKVQSESNLFMDSDSQSHSEVEGWLVGHCRNADTSEEEEEESSECSSDFNIFVFDDTAGKSMAATTSNASGLVAASQEVRVEEIEDDVKLSDTVEMAKSLTNEDFGKLVEQLLLHPDVEDEVVHSLVRGARQERDRVVEMQIQSFETRLAEMTENRKKGRK